MEILVDPTDKIIEEDLKKAEEVVILHNLENEAHFREYEKRYTGMGFTVIYAHYYTGDKSYTMGVVKNWSMKPNG